MIGLGTWQYNDTLAQASLVTAFSMGYRHVDTAYGYENQVGVGKALAASGLPLNELFITSKVPGGLNASATTAALDASLVQLGVAQVDLMLLHWAAKTKAARQAQWLALEAWAKQGKARAIGLSHYCKYQTQDVLEVATLPVALNQNQYHVGMGGDTQPRLHDKAFMEQSGILYEAYSSLCGPCDPPDNKALITGPLVSSIGKAHNKTGAQVALRWVVQQGIPVIPKASNPAYIRDDFALFDFELSDAEMAQLSAATSPAETGTPAAPDDAQDCTAEEPPVVEQERA
jgi:diketogulonate reductase-like aldo/keto reductase